MNRRFYLAALVPACLGVIGGLLYVGRENTHETVGAGETARARIVVNDARSMEIDRTPDVEGLEVDFEAVTLSPSPRATAETLPPTWIWDSTQSRVTVEVPVEVSADAPSGEYTYSIAVSDREDVQFGTTHTREFTVEVV